MLVAAFKLSDHYVHTISNYGYEYALDVDVKELVSVVHFL